MEFVIIKGVLLVIYGILKSLLCIGELIPERIVKRVVDWKILTHDLSTAGLLLILIFLIFSIYTLFHGLSYLKIAPKKIGKFYSYIYSSVIAYFIFGIILVSLYGLILLTDIINKNEKHNDTYKIVGFTGGIIFFISALVALIIKRKFNYLSLFLLLTLIIILIGISVMLIASVYIEKQNGDKEFLVYKVFSAVIVPLTVF